MGDVSAIPSNFFRSYVPGGGIHGSPRLMLILQEKEPATPVSPFAAQSAADAHPLEGAASTKGSLKPPLAGLMGQSTPLLQSMHTCSPTVNP